MRKFIEKFIYNFGLSCTNVKNPQLKLLRANVPQIFKKREMVDVGCGDGRMTQVLAEIFEASIVLGLDSVPALVKNANKRGLRAKIVDIEKDEIEGELAVMWGVLHHLLGRKKVLRKLAENFDYVFIREEIKHFKLFEVGRLLSANELEKIYGNVFGSKNIRIIKDKKNRVLFLFYTNPKLRMVK